MAREWTNRPAGAVGMTVVSHKSSLVSRLIARRQESDYSHAVISLGHGKVLDQPWKWTRIRSEEEWAQERIIDWFVPLRPFDSAEVRQLKSLAKFVEGRIAYSWRSIGGWLLRGRGSSNRNHGLYCSELVAEVYMTIRGRDFSRTEQPWNVDLRTLTIALRDERDFAYVGREW